MGGRAVEAEANHAACSSSASSHRKSEYAVKIRFGYEVTYWLPSPAYMILMLHCQPASGQRLLRPDILTVEPSAPLRFYVDGYGNTCTRLELAGGPLRLRTDALMEDSGEPEREVRSAQEHTLSQLPNEVLVYLLSSRYCDTEILMADAWRLFGQVPPGWGRVQAICDFVHGFVSFGYQHARATRTASETFTERRGVCRDFAHLAIALCRCLNIPARYCTVYLGDIGVPPVDAPMDFAACMEVYLGGEWHMFDPRNNARRIGRIMIARGRDAGDVAISTVFGQWQLQLFRVWIDEVTEGFLA
jgi:transglutaminase-like putative cysteine protease